MAEPDSRQSDEWRREASEHAAAGRWPLCRETARKSLLATPADPFAAYFLSLSSARTAEAGPSGGFARWALAAIARRVLVPLHRELFMLEGIARDNPDALRRAVLIAPGDRTGLINLANSETRRESYGAALATLRRAAIVRPLDPATLGAIARIEGLILDGPGGSAAFARALTLSPADFSGLRNLGLRCRKQDRPMDGVRWFRRAVTVDPKSREAQGELGRALLTAGALEEGWDRLERFRLPEWDPPVAGLPRWNGRPVDGGALLLWSMDKIGDELLFSIFLERARKAAGRVIAVVDSRNVGLLQRLHPDIRFCSEAPEPGGIEEVWRPVAAYPLDFAGRFFSTLPGDMAPEARRLILPARQSGGDGPLRIGISWKSDASLSGGLKSTALSDWGPILEHPECRFFSLQYGEVDADLAACPVVERVAGFDPFGPTLDFAETIASLDLVITVANTTAHVAACTGTPFWVLLPTGFGCSWFWFRERTDSPFYPGARLFRQPAPGAWQPVLRDVAGALGRLVKARRDQS